MSDRESAGPIDRFLPRPDVRERHETLVRAPADVVLRAARELDMASLPLVRAIFWVRATVMGARAAASRPRRADLAGLVAMGWGILADEPGRYVVLGAACRPWEADVTFTPIAPDRFAAFAEPANVKIAWTLEAEPLGPALTRLGTETRAVATDDFARRRFRRYWRAVVIGIRAIRWMLLPAVRRAAEARWAAAAGG